ncbi:putative leader peptide [Rhodococcus gannanensis]|uniref:Leader peptide n=1 Tax=Rhodococcus gannanensis TaxID=1960308 RepID=A0ABW4P9M4_9NOCA
MTDEGLVTAWSRLHIDLCRVSADFCRS